jgi:hypothetical protein
MSRVKSTPKPDVLTPAAIRRQHILASAWHDDLATLADATVRIAHSLARLLAIIEEERAHEVAERTQSLEEAPL